MEPRDLASLSAAANENAPKAIGRFEVLDVLGVGGVARVYKARDPVSNRLVAIKVPKEGVFDSAETERRFWNEARSTAELRHPGIVQVLEVSSEGDTPYIVSEFVSGVALEKLLRKRPPSFQETARIVAEVADALDHAHQRGIIHRDVKPENILVDDSGKPRLMDFGLARSEHADLGVTAEGQLMGTVVYLPPELISGSPRGASPKSDIYSLGVVLYQLLTGQLPFQGKMPDVLQVIVEAEPTPPGLSDGNVPRELEWICLKALEKAPEDRYPTAGEFAADLRRFLMGEPILARPIGRLGRWWRWLRRHLKVFASSVAILLLVLVAICVLLAAKLLRN